MSWEALRLTSRTPSEIYHTIGPNGVDHLLRQMLSACWDKLPGEERKLADWEKLAAEVYDRNMAVWARIKKPSPQNFFEDLRPEPADGFMRQAMVLCFMMLPRGKKGIDAVRQVVGRIYQRNIDAWHEDHVLLTKAPERRKRPAARATKKKARPAGKAKARRK